MYVERECLLICSREIVMAASDFLLRPFRKLPSL